MEKESTGERGMGVRYKGSQGQTKRTVELQEEEEEVHLVYPPFFGKLRSSFNPNKQKIK
jgi:hypothetical protein